jgi:predicted phosphodiesterase
MRHDALDNLRVVLDALWRDLPEQINKAGGRLDFIAFTGDIAYSGKEKEYELAIEHFFQHLLDVTKVTPEKLFVVPGNHDVDWGLINLINPEILLSLTNRDQVTALLIDDDKRRLLFGAMSGYTKFVQRYFSQVDDHPILRDPPYYYVQHIVLENCSVALFGLNSAWLSGFTKDAQDRVTDRGHLLIGDKQVGDAFREAEDATVRIALMHHPPSCLMEFDESDIKRWLRSGCDFVLRGHLHVPDFVREKALGGEAINIPAGTVYKGRQWLNGYNLVCLDFDADQGKIILRRYSDERREWVKDTQSTGDELDGVVEFELPASLAPSAPLAPPPPASPVGRVIPEIKPRSLASRVLSEIKPRWLPLGRERETQLLEAFLQQETRHTLWVHGEAGCGLKEFLQIARALLECIAVDIIHFDAEDAAFGVAVDQHYLLDRLERWMGTGSKGSLGRIGEDVDQRLSRWLPDAESYLAESDRRLVLVFANCHLLTPAVREWVGSTLWSRVHKSLAKHNPLAIFACEGSAPACPANDQENRIHLAEFTVQDVERFLHTVSPLDPKEIPNLARRIHSGNTDDFLAPPRRVYRNLIVHLFRTQALPLPPYYGQEKRLTDSNFDVFLCYNSEDRSAVKRIGESLKKRGILPWMDEWESRPGLPWQRVLEEQIRQIKSAAVFIGKEGIGPWQQMELEAFLREFVDRGCPVIPVLLLDAPKKPKLPIFLKGMTWVDFRKDDPDPLERLIWGITGERDWAP